MHESGGILTPLEVSSASPENHPKLWKWRLEWLAQTGIEKLVGILPGPLAFRLGEVLGGLAWHCLPTRRRIVLRNLRIAFHGEHDLPALRVMARQSFRRTGANLLSALHSAGLSAAEIDSIVTVENPELAEAALSKSPGVVLMPCHMGNWEILTRIHRKLPSGHANGALYRPLNNPLLDARVLEQREKEGTRLFSKRDSFHQITGFVRDGGILGILADQRAGTHGEVARFFGRLTRCSPLPGLIARRSRCEVLGMSLTTAAPGKWRVRFHALNGPISTATCADAIERSMRDSPLDVFWLQERWRVDVRSRLPIRQWLGAESSSEGKQHRALLWLAGAPTSWQPSEEWTHPDLIYEIVLAPEQETPSWLTGSETIHRVPAGSLDKAIAAIDAATALPVDYILTCNAPEALKKAAEREVIRLVSLPRPQ